MSAFLPYLVLLVAIVAFVCLAYATRGPVDKRAAEERRRRRLESQQERFFRQQSWHFWRDFFNR